MSEIEEHKGPQPRVESPNSSKQGITVQEKNADVTLRLLEDHGDQFGPLTDEAEKKLRRKLYLRVMLLLSAINIMLFVSGSYQCSLLEFQQFADVFPPQVDKSVLGYAAILGLFEETGISKTQYNNLNTMFYVGKSTQTSNINPPQRC